MLSALALASGVAVVLASQTSAASGSWQRAWGKNVNGGGVFGICTVASGCLMGAPGGLGGEMSLPSGVATDATGNVYIVDQNNSRIQKFDSSGAFLRTWGKNVAFGGVFEVCTVAASCSSGIAGGLGGEMNGASGVATDPAGDVYLADLLNNRIQKFDSSGAFLRAWGKGVNGGGVFGICTTAASCQPGVAGSLGGEMNSPVSVAADAAGAVYVADYFNNRIQKFDSAGNFLRAWGKDVVSGNLGTGFEACIPPLDLCKAGVPGGMGGNMSLPAGVTTDGAGAVYLAEQGNNRIQKFDSSGNFLRAWGKGVSGGGVFGICTTAASCEAGVAGSLGGEMDDPLSVATDAAGDVYLADRDNNRIQKFDSSGAFLRAWGKGVNGGGVFGICTTAASCQPGVAGGLGGEMNSPVSVAADASGNLYLADSLNNRIQKFVDPLPPATPPSGPAPMGGAAPTGQRAAALRKCKKKFHGKSKAKKRKKCKRKASHLPV